MIKIIRDSMVDVLGVSLMHSTENLITPFERESDGIVPEEKFG